MEVKLHSIKFGGLQSSLVAKHSVGGLWTQDIGGIRRSSSVMWKQGAMGTWC